MYFNTAFDRVNHRGLMCYIGTQLLIGYAASGLKLRWCDSICVLGKFLKDRRQRVVVDGKHSNLVIVVSGVQHGSVLVFLLFIIHDRSF